MYVCMYVCMYICIMYVGMYICPTHNTINPMYTEQLRDVVPPPSQNTVAVCNQITPLIPYSISSRLVTLLKINDAPIRVSDIFDLTVSFKLIHFSFQISLLFFFFLEMSTSFTSYIV